MNRNDKTRKTVLVALMAAVVVAGSAARIVLPIDVGGTTAFHLGNITCALAGLLLGPIGGLAAGIGSALYDLFNPLYVMEIPFTFFNKLMLGFVAGLIAQAGGGKKPTFLRNIIATTGGALTYYVLYFIKCYFYNGLLVQGLPSTASLLALIPRIPTSIFNGVVAILLAPPLARAIQAALTRSNLLLVSEPSRALSRGQKIAIGVLAVAVTAAIAAVSILAARQLSL